MYNEINYNKNNKAFSLIELSIVLIIMGLLVAGIMGGSSLIWSAKIRATVNQYYEYKTAYNSYYARYGHVPNEDPDKPGLIYKRTGFKYLYDSGFINEKPLVKIDDVNVQVLVSKLSNAVWNLGAYDMETFREDIGEINMLDIGAKWYFNEIGDAQQLNYKEAYALDSKIDDAKPDTGIAIAFTNYLVREYSFGDENSNERKTEMYFKMDF